MILLSKDKIDNVNIVYTLIQLIVVCQSPVTSDVNIIALFYTKVYPEQPHKSCEM